MDFEKIKELIKLVNDSELAFFELNTGNESIKMDKSFNRSINGNATDSPANYPEKKNNLYVNEVKEEQKEINKSIEDESAVSKENVKVITSPMVGTFYASSSPNSDPFVKPGDAIKNGTVICIIEAMKLMNEIESEYTGTIVKCLVKNGDMVEYGQPLFEYKED